MISHAEALRIVLAHTSPLRAVEIQTGRSLGLGLARAIRATMPMPRFDQSAVDGYAVSSSDFEVASRTGMVELEVIGEVPAGVRRVRRLRPGTALRVFTGSPLPAGADAVLMQEDCERVADSVRSGAVVRKGQNVRWAGEECSRGDVLLGPGVRITPPVIALLSAFGIARVHVYGCPRVTVVTMGDELLRAGESPRRYAIHDSNAPGLAAALRVMGLRAPKRIQVPDDQARLRRAMRSALTRSDVLITVGGASVGDHDHVRAAWEELGITAHFDRVAMKPGKPTGFGMAPGGTRVFALPGNPVAALVSFQLFVRPALRAMMGLSPESRRTSIVRLSTELRHRPGRQEWVRVRLSASEDGDIDVATPLLTQGSHMLSGIALADALLIVPADKGDLPAGTLAEVLPLEWG